MGKAIAVRSGNGVFLVETDESVSLPPDFAPVAAPAPLSSAASHDAAGRLPVGMRPVSSVSGIARDFSEVRDLVVSCCNSLYDAIAQIQKPDRVAVEFGVKLAGEAGVPMLTKASGEANFKISIEWKAQP